MSRTTRVIDCSPQNVFDVLADGWTYASWVVGAARIRAVDEGFPAVGSRIHHSVGLWPMLLSDTTEVEHVDPPLELVLTVRAWPTGEGRVQLLLEADGDRTRVTMVEDVTSGPARLLLKPVRQVLFSLRNIEALRRLAYLAESGARAKHPPP